MMMHFFALVQCVAKACYSYKLPNTLYMANWEARVSLHVLWLLYPLLVQYIQALAVMHISFACSTADALIAPQLQPIVLQELFPESYAETAGWLRSEVHANEDSLERCSAQLQRLVNASPEFQALAEHCQVRFTPWQSSVLPCVVI